jgi:hypothetical protein
MCITCGFSTSTMVTRTHFNVRYIYTTCFVHIWYTFFVLISLSGGSCPVPLKRGNFSDTFDMRVAYPQFWYRSTRVSSRDTKLQTYLTHTCYYFRWMFWWPCIIVHQWSKTNVMHFLFNLLKIKGLYMFRALFAHPQEALHKRHLVYCVCVMFCFVCLP